MHGLDYSAVHLWITTRTCPHVTSRVSVSVLFAFVCCKMPVLDMLPAQHRHRSLVLALVPLLLLLLFLNAEPQWTIWLLERYTNYEVHASIQPPSSCTCIRQSKTVQSAGPFCVVKYRFLSTLSLLIVWGRWRGGGAFTYVSGPAGEGGLLFPTDLLTCTSADFRFILLLLTILPNSPITLILPFYSDIHVRSTHHECLSTNVEMKSLTSTKTPLAFVSMVSAKF